MADQEIKEKLDAILDKIEEIKKGVNKILDIINKTVKINDDNFEYICQKMKNASWSPAIDPDFICDETSEDDKMMRARAIIATLNIGAEKNKKILDYGCGEGHVSIAISEICSPSLIIGYDIKKQWKDHSKDVILTTKYKEVAEKAPFDEIFLHDVIDHLEEINPVDCLNQLGKMLSPGGIIKLRLHPWCARHGAHQYKQLNKQHVHLIFTDEELKKLGVKDLPFNIKIFDSVEYEKIINDVFKGSGLECIYRKGHYEQAGPIFEQDPILKERVLRHYPAQTAINYMTVELNFMDIWFKKKQ